MRANKKPEGGRQTRVSAGGSVLVCGSGAQQQLVRIFGDEPTEHVHPIRRLTTDRKAEAPALSPAELESGVHEFIDADYRGNLEGSPLAVFPDGDEWKEEVGAVFSLQQ